MKSVSRISLPSKLSLVYITQFSEYSSGLAIFGLVTFLALRDLENGTNLQVMLSLALAIACSGVILEIPSRFTL
jgi:hypothetical protein